MAQIKKEGLKEIIEVKDHTENLFVLFSDGPRGQATGRRTSASLTNENPIRYPVAPTTGLIR